MFFIAGINQKREEVDYHETVICDLCGSYGRYEIIKEYSQLSLFFIPVFKWGQTYYVRTSCCGSLYELDRQAGIDIEKGRISRINKDQLHPIKRGFSGQKTCPSCSYRLDSDYKYCPNCGHKLGR